MEFYIGQQFKEFYPAEAVKWVNRNDCGIDLVSDNPKIWEITKTQHSEEEIRMVRIEELQSFLKSTDWYCSRYVDIGTPIPDDIKQQRSNARIEIDRLKHELKPVTNEVTDVEPTHTDLPID